MFAYSLFEIFALSLVIALVAWQTQRTRKEIINLRKTEILAAPKGQGLATARGIRYLLFPLQRPFIFFLGTVVVLSWSSRLVFAEGLLLWKGSSLNLIFFTATTYYLLLGASIYYALWAFSFEERGVGDIYLCRNHLLIFLLGVMGWLLFAPEVGHVYLSLSLIFAVVTRCQAAIYLNRLMDGPWL